MGLHFSNSRVAMLTRRVLMLSSVSAVLVLIGGAVNLFSGSASFPAVLFGIVLGLLVPMCGYCGAKNNDSNQMCCFCCCNFLGGCLQIVQIIMVIIVSQGLSAVLDHCDPAEPDPTFQCPTE